MLVDITDALRRGDHATALANARSYAAAEPANPVALHLLGVALQQTGDRAGAKQAFEQALELAPDRPAAYFGLAESLLAEGDQAGATRRLHEALALDPNKIGPYLMLISLALGRGDQAEAERNLRLAQRVDPDRPQVLIAEGQVRQAGGDLDGALKAFTAAVTAAPELPAAQLAIGQAYLMRAMWPFAEQALRNALNLSPKRSPSTLRALAEACRRQGKFNETLKALNELLALTPADLGARALRSEILMQGGRPDIALQDQMAILQQRPDEPRTVFFASLELARSGRGAEAVRLVESALAAIHEGRSQEERDLLWRARLNLTGFLGEDAKPVLDRWLAALPESPQLHDMLAGYHSGIGETQIALAFADRALAANPALPTSLNVRFAHDLREEPEAVVRRAEPLLPEAKDPALARLLLAWTGVALDALGRHDEAAARWRDMCRIPPPGQLFPPMPESGDKAPAGEGAGTLLFSPPGLNAEFLLRKLRESLGERMLLDRLDGRGRDDGFGRVRPPAGHEQAGSAARWRAALEAAGQDPANVVDWMPFVDDYTLSALGGARVVALLADPRDLLLGWMVYGTVHNFMFSDEPVRSAEWLAQSLGALADYRDLHPGAVHVVRLDRDAGKAEQALEKLLELPQPLTALFGPGPRFQPGHWKHYRELFADAFALLAPVAARLGYPD